MLNGPLKVSQITKCWFPYLFQFSLNPGTFTTFSKINAFSWFSFALFLIQEKPLTVITMDQAKINRNNRTLEYNDTIQAEDNVNRDNIKLFALTFLSRPYAMAAAVGSLMILKTSKPAMTPASLVA